MGKKDGGTWEPQWSRTGSARPDGTPTLTRVEDILKSIRADSGRDIPLFACRRCGDCCDFDSMGLILFPNEVGLFPADLVEPHYGVRRGSGIEVRASVLKSGPCPHLSASGCSIYAKRPIHCRSYPLVHYGGTSYMFPGCPGRLSFPTPDMFRAMRSFYCGTAFLYTDEEEAVGFSDGEWLPLDQFLLTARERALDAAIQERQVRCPVAMEIRIAGMPRFRFVIPDDYLRETPG